MTNANSAFVLAEDAINALQARVEGLISVPSDENYDRLRMAWNLSVDQHPVIIIVAKRAADISAAIEFAHSANLEIAIQGSGHGVMRPANGSLLLITTELKDVIIDPEGQTAWVEAGAKWGSVLEKAQEHGLAPLLGSSPDVGVVGYTLGGGIGWLARKHGLATDSVYYFEMITPEGNHLRVSETENPDLFWGLRGGGGNFGVITGLKIQLYPVTTVYGGNLIYPATLAKDILKRYQEWIQNAPEELTSSVALMNFPPIPEIPEFLRGQSVVMVRGCYCGDVQDGETLVNQWRAWQKPMVDDFKVMSFADVATISNDPIDPIPGFSTGAWVKELTDHAIDTLVEFGVSNNGSSPLIATEIRHVGGGTISKVDPSVSAYGNRDAQLVLQLIGVTPTPEIHSHVKAYAMQFKEALAQSLTGRVYLNFLEGDEARKRSRDGFSPEAFERLAELKANADRDNRFNHSFELRSN